MSALRRALPLWLALVAAYALTLAVDDRLTPREAHRLLVAESIATDGDLDVADDARSGDTRIGPPGTPADGGPTPIRLPEPIEGRTLEPVSAGFGLFTAPAYALGGKTAVRLWLAMWLAAAFCVAAALGRRLVPDPWPGRAALVAGLSPPALGAATAISPEGAGAALLAGSALLALHVREDPRAVFAFWCAVLGGMAPWLALELLAPALVIAFALVRWMRRRRRGLTGFVALEVVLTSVVVHLTVHERLYAAFSPLHPEPTGAAGLGEHLERATRAVTLWTDLDRGLLRWAPVALLLLVAVWLLWRSRRDRLASVVADQVDVEVAAGFLLLLTASVAVVAVFLAPSVAGPWFPGRHLLAAAPFVAALGAWALRFAPRTGAVLSAITLATSATLLFADTLRPPGGLLF